MTVEHNCIHLRCVKAVFETVARYPNLAEEFLNRSYISPSTTFTYPHATR